LAVLGFRLKSLVPEPIDLEPETVVLEPEAATPRLGAAEVASISSYVLASKTG